jgi:hypothetical protein
MVLGYAALGATAGAASPQTRKPSGAEWDQVRPLFTLVQEVAGGRAAPADVALAWQCHFLRAHAGEVFVPFSLIVASGRFESFPLAMYVRVVARGAPAPAPLPGDPLAHYPFEDAAVVDRADNGRISRGFTAPPGDYDVYVALRERVGAASVSPKTAVLKQHVTVPDLASGLTASSVIVLDRSEVDPSNRRLTLEEQLDEPYTHWGIRLTPAVGTTFGRGRALAVIFLVYNTGATADDKPDVEVSYTFYRRTGTTETLFARAPPERFDAKTLGPRFHVSAGDLIIAGQEMPLAGFPDGAYRLEIQVTDAISRNLFTRDVNFRVEGK